MFELGIFIVPELGKEIICQVCKVSIEYRRTATDKEETIRSHYINLHSGEIFCNPKEKVIFRISREHV